MAQVHFDGYNRRFGGDGTHEALDWQEYDQCVTAFKREQIHQDIINTEIRELSYPLKVVGFWSVLVLY